MMMRSLVALGLVVSCLSGSAVFAQESVGGAAGSPGLFALRDSPGLGIQDNAGMFRLDAVVKGRESIQQFRRDYHRDLFIETFDHVPAADQKHVKGLGRKPLEQYFAGWATTRAKAIGIDGIYLLICREPRHVYVLVYPKTPEQAFSEENTLELRRQLERELPKSADGALSDAIVFVGQMVKDNLAERQSTALSLPFQTIILIIAGVVGFWLLLALVRAILIRSAGSDPAHAGLASGFFGALFGTTAGHWVYDHLFRAHPPAAPAPESEFLHPPPPQPLPEQEESSRWS